MKVFADLHHCALFYSLQLLFEKRLNCELYRPAGIEWHQQGYWQLYPGVHESTARQYLTLEQCFKRDVHGFLLPERMKLNDHYTVEDGIYYIEDPSTKKVHRGITLEKFKETKFDIIISSVPSHIPIYNNLIAQFQPQAKHIFQVGNAWGHLPGVKNILASTAPFAVPPDINVCYYHQEFDLDVFRYEPPTSHNKVYSFIHYMREMELHRAYKQALPEFEFKTYGAGMEYDLCYMGDIADACREMGWFYSTKPEGDGMGHCHSEDTEVLTDSGWKLFPELNPKDKVATLNQKTGELQYQQPTAYHAFEYKGDMCHFDSRIMDVLVTPNHRMWIEEYADDSSSKGWRFKEAKDLNYISRSPRKRVGFKVAADEWKGGNTCSIEKARFLGWYLAEGCVKKTNYKSRITGEAKEGAHAVIIDNTNFQYIEEVQKLLNSLGYTNSSISKCSMERKRQLYRKNGDPCPKKQVYRLWVGSKELYDVFKEYGKCYDKFIPPEILNGNREILWSFLEAFTLGDGTIDQRSGGEEKMCRFKRIDSVAQEDGINKIQKGKSTAITISISSKRMADSLQEIAIKLGLRSRMRRKNPVNIGKQYLWSLSISTELSPSYSHLLTKRKLFEPYKLVSYKGMVYCVTVPNSLVVTRRNGIPVVTGNSLHNAYAVGRPAFMKVNYYKGKLAEPLLIDGSTCIDISRRSIHENSQLIRFFSQPDNHRKMCENAYKRFKQIVDFDAEFENIKVFLSNLR